MDSTCFKTLKLHNFYKMLGGFKILELTNNLSHLVPIFKKINEKLGQI